MKTLKFVFILLITVLLAGCGSQQETATSPETQGTDPVEAAQPTEPPQPATESAPQSLTDLDALVGIWRGRPAGGLLQIDENHQTTFAQTMADLEGTSVGPTMYRGALSLEGSTLYFEDARCEAEGPGKYEIFLSADGVLSFVALEDSCDERLNNLMGQRIEPQIDIVWHLLTTELP